jgi:hypothetical protein
MVRLAPAAIAVVNGYAPASGIIKIITGMACGQKEQK